MEERSAEEMVQREERVGKERAEGEEERDDESDTRGEEGEGHQGKESEDFAGSRRARPGVPAFSDEDEIEMLEFVKANTVLYA